MAKNPGGANRHNNAGAGTGDVFEQTLRRLIRMAKSQRRDFLVYLLTMALMEARKEKPPSSRISADR